MMKIHTTQNLSSSAENKSTNIAMRKQLRYQKYSDASIPSSVNDTFEGSMSFKGKKSAVDKAVEAAKRTFGDRVANKRGIEKLLGSDSFGKALDWTATQEVLVQSGSALGVCCLLRPGTLALFPGDKNNKQDFLYAAAHSISSGLWGFVVPLMFIKPPTSGVNHVLNNAGKYIKDDMLRKMYPHLDMESIYVMQDGKKVRRPVEEWLDTSARKFSADTKNVKKIFRPVHITEASEDTLKEKVKDIKLESIKKDDSTRLSANDWKSESGNKIKIALEDMFICVKDEARKGTQYYPLEFVNEEILKEIYPKLDTKSITRDGVRLHPDQWKTIEGNNFVMNMDEVFLSSARDSAETIPLIAGFTRTDAKGKAKDICYQNNARDAHDLGTEITTDMLEAAEVNTIKQKLGAWLPDIIVTYPRAAATIAVLPFILKNVFGLEKSKKPAPEPVAEVKDNSVTEEVTDLELETSGKEVA